MKNYKTFKILAMNILFGLTMLSVVQSCNDDDDGNGRFQGCEVDRGEYENVVNIEGTINYFDGADVYYVRYVPETEEGANIDTVIYGIVCDLEDDLKTVGTVVIFSGILENLIGNEESLFEPLPSGTEIYLLNQSSLEIKQ